MEIDTNKFKVWKLPNPMLLHWVLNPGIAFNELILGQRLPKILLIDQTSSAPLMERQYIPCPSCGAINDGRLWAKGNSFGHWFGILCPRCGSDIPCLLNLTSALVLAVAFPLWLPARALLKGKWRQWELGRLQAISASPLVTSQKTSWLRSGALFGFVMFCFMALPKILAGHLSAHQIGAQIAVWSLAGLLFGVVMWLCVGKRK